MRSSCPSFSRSTRSSGRGCSWAEPLPPGWVSAPAVGWTTAGIAGGVAALASGVGAYLGFSSMARPSVAKHAAPLRQALADAEQLVEHEKDWIKNKFEGKAQGAREEARVHGPRRRRTCSRAELAEFQSRHQKQTEEADKTYPARLEQIRVRRDEGLKKAEEHFPPRIAALKEKYEKDRRELDESYRKTKETTKQHYDQAWTNLIKNWTEGMARIDQTVNEVREECERRFLEWAQARARRLEAADRGPARPAVRRLRRRSQPVPQRHSRRPAAQIGADPLSASGPVAVPDPGLDAHQGGRRGQGRGDHAAAIAHAPLPDLGSTGQGSVHDRRPGRPGRELRRLHAPGRLSRAAGHQPHLDRGAAHRAAADRPHRAHGERDPEIPAQRIRDDRGIQHHGRRGRRAVPDPGRRQFPDEFQRRGAAAA